MKLLAKLKRKFVLFLENENPQEWVVYWTNLREYKRVIGLRYWSKVITETLNVTDYRVITKLFVHSFLSWFIHSRPPLCKVWSLGVTFQL